MIVCVQHEPRDPLEILAFGVVVQVSPPVALEVWIERDSDESELAVATHVDRVGLLNRLRGW